jgi:iron(III) transport system ATP-binding protein
MTTAAPAIAVELSGLGKAFGLVRVLDGVSLKVPTGAFTSLLGPSGCGKTTLLNLIGGLDKPTEGEIRFGGDLVYSAAQAVDLPTEKRNVGYVFQSYALWPHMKVLDNVGYPLRIRRVPKTERLERAREMLRRLELDALADRYPYQLSGGQQQRVAIARSLVYQPRLLLLDEPLSNLDAQLRERARAWLKQVHESFGLTTILVTHDQSEALSLSDRVVLLSKGRIEQEGPAEEIYERPRTAYAAEFVGGANVLRGRLDATGTALLTADGSRIPHSGVPGTPGAEAAIAIRPQAIRIAEGTTAPDGAVLNFTAEAVLYLGATWEITGTSPVGPLRLLLPSRPPASPFDIVLPTAACLPVAP